MIENLIKIKYLNFLKNQIKIKMIIVIFNTKIKISHNNFTQENSLKYFITAYLISEGYYEDKYNYFYR